VFCTDCDGCILEVVPSSLQQVEQVEQGRAGQGRAANEVGMANKLTERNEPVCCIFGVVLSGPCALCGAAQGTR
jgi:hypothetical protein